MFGPSAEQETPEQKEFRMNFNVAKANRLSDSQAVIAAGLQQAGYLVGYVFDPSEQRMKCHNLGPSSNTLG